MILSLLHRFSLNHYRIINPLSPKNDRAVLKAFVYREICNVILTWLFWICVMKILLTCAYSEHLSLERMKESARSNVKHQLVNYPSEADIIIFVENYEADAFLTRVKTNENYRNFSDKCFVFCENDNTFPCIPGVYASSSRKLKDLLPFSPGPYLWMMRESKVALSMPSSTIPKYLFSWVGDASTHKVREEVCSLRHADSFIKDVGRSAQSFLYEEDKEKETYWQTSFDEIMADSCFVLCPRGISPNSIRLFETMRMGRVPVIISDDLWLKEGPDWNNFSLRVAEDQVESIPKLIESHRANFFEMACLARSEWENWFSPQVLFDRTVESCAALQGRHKPCRINKMKALLVEPHLRDFVRMLRHGEFNVIQSLVR